VDPAGLKETVRTTVVRFLIICCGGALGSGARYLVSSWVARMAGSRFPLGTILINASGSFLLGLLAELALRGVVSFDLRLVLGTGVLGGYTTYSSFNHETLRLAGEGSRGGAVLNLAVTVAGCLVAGALGLFVGGLFPGGEGR
jgi:CrcB protein